jgi:hypothetical protein
LRQWCSKAKLRFDHEDDVSNIITFPRQPRRGLAEVELDLKLFREQSPDETLLIEQTLVLELRMAALRLAGLSGAARAREVLEAQLNEASA